MSLLWNLKLSIIDLFWLNQTWVLTRKWCNNDHWKGSQHNIRLSSTLPPANSQGYLQLTVDLPILPSMVSNCCCGNRCNLKDQPAGDKHWCPGCKQPIHAVCGVLDESQESIAYYMKLVPQLWWRMKDASAAVETKTTTKTEDQEKKPPPNSMRPEAPLEPLTDKKKSGRPTMSKGPFKMVVPAHPTDSLLFTGRQVAFALDGSDRPQWLNNPILPQNGEDIGGIRYILGNVSRSKSTNTKTPCLIEWEQG